MKLLNSHRQISRISDWLKLKRIMAWILVPFNELRRLVDQRRKHINYLMIWYLELKHLWSDNHKDDTTPLTSMILITLILPHMSKVPALFTDWIYSSMMESLVVDFHDPICLILPSTRSSILKDQPWQVSSYTMFIEKVDIWANIQLHVSLGSNFATSASHKPPFAHTDMDYFGPILEKRGRVTVQRYGVIFNSFSSRVVHLEVVYSLKTSSCNNAIWIYMSRKDPIEVLRYNNGTNPVGTKHEPIQ